MSKSRLWIVAAVILAAAAVAAAVIATKDRAPFRDAFRRAEIALTIGKTVRSEYGTVFDVRGISGLDAFRDTPRAQEYYKALEEVSRPLDLPLFFGDKSRLIELNVAVGQWAALLREPRGNWLSYSPEMQTAQTKLEGAILALSQTTSANVVSQGTTDGKEQVAGILFKAGEFERTMEAKDEAKRKGEEEEERRHEAAQKKYREKVLTERAEDERISLERQNAALQGRQRETTKATPEIRRAPEREGVAEKLSGGSFATETLTGSVPAAPRPTAPPPKN